MNKIIHFFFLLLLFACSSPDSNCEGNCKDGYGRYNWPNGGYDEGNWLNGQLEGFGTQVQGKEEFLGDIYEGLFKNGLYHGNGTYQDISEGTIYTGNWILGWPEGKGSLKFTDDSGCKGRSYVGDFSQGVRKGKGLEIWGEETVNAGCIYEGQWENNTRQGIGKYTWPDGGVYTGQWVNDDQHGQGKYVFPDGEIFNGTWVHGYCNKLDRLLLDKESNSQ